MAAEACVQTADPALDILQSLDGRVASLERADLARLLLPVVRRLEAPLGSHEFGNLAEAALTACRRLHARARSREALPLARALLARARGLSDSRLQCRMASVCGILHADVGDPVDAIEHHVEALRLAGDDRVTASLIWNNIGLAMSFAGHSAMASRCYDRALAAVEGLPGPLQARYAALANLAQSQFDTAAYEEGLVSACLALRDEGSRGDPMDALLLRRNLVRLFVAVGRVEDAEPYVLDAATLAQRVRTPRAAIAASLARAVYDLARGEADVGLTRLDAALGLAREVPAALRDTLACVVRAEEMAGNSERALLRLGELSDLIYGPAVAAARQHIEIASVAEREHARGERQRQEQDRARLISKLRAPDRPGGWSAFERLAVTACIRVEPTGLHGKRVGALAKALAMASGIDPLHALEIGFACELHDIGMVSVTEEMLSNRPFVPGVEQAVIERHVRAGAEILSGDDHPRIFLAREVVRYHHAHWDGSGHPEGVAGLRIPFAARVCAVADTYDDLVCGTRGAPRRTMDGALEQMRAQAGRRLDPELVARFESMIRAESDDLGLDLSAGLGMENFQQLVSALQEDRGFV